MTLYSLLAAVHLLYLHFSSHATFKASVFQQNYKLMRQVVSVTEIGVICKRVLRKGVIYWLRKVPSEQSHQHDSRRSRDSLASRHKICSSVFCSSRMYTQPTLWKCSSWGPPISSNFGCISHPSDACGYPLWGAPCRVPLQQQMGSKYPALFHIVSSYSEETR